jgi:UDP-2-acetamido-3-amino-2,3-dideoxy-glucuronate N-acetyltransferase
VDRSVAVVGFGGWGKNLARNFSELGALKMICEPDSSRRSVAARRYPKVESRPDFSAVLADDSIQAVVISSPAATHYRLARAALMAGKDTFVEKPLALTPKEGEELVDLAREKDRILMVGHLLRYHPAVAKVRELVQEGALGKIQYLYSNRLNIGKIRTEENILWSFAPHDISVMLALLGQEPTSCSCQGAAYLNSDVADVTLSELAFPGGVNAHIFVSWLHPFKEHRLVVIGSEKMAVFNDTASEKLKIYPHRVEWKQQIPTAVKAEGEIVKIESTEPLRLECQHFLECIATRNPPLTDGAEGLRVLRILDRLQKSMEDGWAEGATPLLPDASGASTEDPARYFVHPTAVVDEPCEIGDGTKIWHFSHVMKNTRIGRNCSFGQNCHVAGDVIIGNWVKAQNNVSIYTGTEIEDFVFLGPSCVLTNITNPRSEINRHALYEKTLLQRGCTIGANATVLCGITIGRYAFIGAGAVVTRTVPDYALMVGSPARQVGWMSRHGLPLKNPDAEGIYTCPESGWRYQEVEQGVLRCLDFGEEEPLPEEQRKGRVSYGEIIARMEE